MKLLAISGEINPENIGGAEAHFVEVLKRVTPKFDRVTVLGKISYPVISNLNWLTYSLWVIPLALKEKFDLIWLKQEYLVWAGFILKIITGKPVYVTCQNPNLATQEWVGKGAAAKAFQKYLGPAFNSFLMFPLRYMDTVAAVSSYSANLTKKYGANKIVVIPNGVDIEKYPIHNTKYIMHKPFRIITTSSLIPRNGIDTLIKACALLDFDFELTIAGDGPERAGLEKLAQGLPVKFLGRVPPGQIPNLLMTSDLFIRPSRFEGFGNSFIEAMAAGVPVIGTPVGGITDFLTDGKTGVLVPPDDPPALAAAISRKESYVKSALELVQKKYTWDNIANQVFEQMQRLCS